MPALATTVTSRPHFWTAAATRASLYWGSRTSPGRATAYSSPSSPTSEAKRSLRRAPDATLAPAPTSARAVAAPIPALAPVIAATVPSIERVGRYDKGAPPEWRGRQEHGRPV